MRYFLFLIPFFLQAEISALYLSWYEDPTTTITIQWHSPESEFGDTIWIKDLDDEWHPFHGEHTRINDLLIHSTTVRYLVPDTEYSFRINQSPTIYRFKTAPDTLPIKFVIGGDVYQNIKRFRRMAKTVASHNPLFVVLGGDLAYALTKHPFRGSALKRWNAFFKDYKNLMVTEDGRLIPFLVVPGNHDIAPDQYELFFSLFAFPKKQLYRTVDFGKYLSLFLLDTGHFQPVEGRQTLWLEKSLKTHTDIPYRFAVYHVAAYPSHYSYHGIIPKKIRANWSPLFEKYHLNAAFENHNHAYKKTFPLKANQTDPNGVIYLGDGGWGANPRRTNDLWYLSKKKRTSSVLLIQLTNEEAKIDAIDFLNNPIDQTTIPINSH